MILPHILSHDLHLSRQRQSTPHLLQIPAKSEFLPVVINNTKGEFIHIHSLTEIKLEPWINGQSKIRIIPTEGEEGFITVPLLDWDSDKLDDLIPHFISSCLELSTEQKWDNVFKGRGSLKRAFDYIRNKSGMEGQPHICLIPRELNGTKIRKLFGTKNLDDNSLKYKGYCRIQPCRVEYPVFLSRSDMVGIYTQFLGGRTCILLHNVKNGIAFCP